MDFDKDISLQEWTREQPLAVLALDSADRAVLRIADERDAVQKKTFTKWVNKHLKKANRQIRDLFEDLRDGHNLISLLEVLTGEQLPRERGQMRFHMLHNIDTALHFLHCKKIKLVNIRSEDIVDGNPKLTLGLIWTIILHFQISDIVVGQEPNVSAKDYLLRWAKKTTHKYPGVHVQDFSKSWRDGLAFSAIIHRNRPDLIDWRTAKSQRVRERIETAFHVVEKEYGVTRLLDPEDVDTHEPDEKSLITYISSLHEVFPEPPAIHPLFDSVAQQRVQEYRELSSSLLIWIREKYSLMQDRSFPPTLIEMKKLASESSRFRSEELPPRQRDKNYLVQLYRELEKYFKTVGEIDVEPELRIDNIERSWAKLMTAYQERDRHIIEEIKRLEKLQRLAEKVHREIKQTDSTLDTIEHNVESESRRIERLHPLEAKKIADQLDQDLAIVEQNIQSLKTDVNTLKNGRYSQAGDLDKRVHKLHEKWVNIRRLLHNKILQPLANLSFPIEERTITKHVRTVQETRNVDTNPHFMSLQEHIEWCKKKLKQLKKSEYGTDLQSVQTERDLHQKEHRQIDQFHSKVEACVKARSYFNGEELSLYNQHLGQLQKIYAELLTVSTNRMNDLETLYDFIQSATKELQWLNEKEKEEITREWSDTKMNVNSVEKHFERLMSEMEKREIQISSVQERGEILVIQNHPGSKAIEAYMAGMQAQWAWLLQLTHCLETHTANTRQYQIFFSDIATAEEWLKEKDEVMNSEFSQGDFSLDVGERLLQGMQSLRDELNSFGDQVQALTLRAQDIVPLKQRRQPVTRPLTVTAICNYKQNNFSVEKNKECTLLDNSGRVKWRVHNEKGVECQVPGVCFVIPPPDKDALDAADRLRRQYDRSIALWQKKQLRMRQNMIFATIKVVKGWDLPQFIAIGAEQRNAIRKALNEDADKLMAEGDPSDPQLRRLRREMDEVNRLFDEFEKRARAEEESKNQTRVFNNQIASLTVSLDEFERIINQRVLAALPRDIDTLQHLVLEHKEFESRLRNVEPEIEACKDTFRSITLKTPQHKKDLERVLDKWKYIWNTSNLYIERLKCVEIVLVGMEDATQVISEFENKLAMFEELPSTPKGLEAVHDDLLRLQSAVGQQQIAMDQLNDDFDNTRRLTEKSRPNQRSPHADVDRMDKEIQKLNSRWGNVCSQLADRLRGCETAYNLLKNYKTAKSNEDSWLDEQYGKLENLEPLKVRAKDNLEATRNLLNSVVERTPIIEQVNVNGGRFIREGKIWSKGLQKYRELLLEDQPSLDAEFFRSPKRINGNGQPNPGVEEIGAELDELNGRFQHLIDQLYARLREIAARCPGDIVTLRLVEQMQPQPFRTFRSEFHMSSASEVTSTFTTTTHYSQQYVKTRTTRERDENGKSELDNARSVDKNNFTTKTQIVRERERDVTWPKKPPQSPNDVFDGISDLRGILNPYNGQIMTVREAIISRILDVRTGQLITSPDGHLQSVQDAMKSGLIDPAIASKLQSPCGIVENGKELTLLEAIQREIHEAEHPGVDPAEKLKVGEEYAALLQHTEVKLQTSALALTDALNQSLVDEKTGWIVDRNTGNKYQIDAALKTNVIDGDVREIVDPATDSKVTVVQAIAGGIINPRLGKYCLGHEKLSLVEAKRRMLIVKPKTLSELFDENLIDDAALILSPLHRSYLTVTAAADAGVLDYDKINCILDFRTNELITLAQAISDGILDDSSFKNLVTGEVISIKEAVHRGYIISVVKKSIFDVAAFRPPNSEGGPENFISFNAANGKGYISKKSGGSLVVDSKSGKLTSFSEGVVSGDVKKEVFDMLQRGIGIYGEDKKELSVLQAVFEGHIDPRTGNLIDLTSNKVVYLNEAIAKHLITPEGAAMLNSLLNLTVSTKITHRLVQRYVTVTKKNIENVLTYTEALRSGYIDNEAQIFTNPATQERIPIVQAISDGLLSPDVENSKLVISQKSHNVHVPPADGWALQEAIESQLFDVNTGMFVIPGTDRLTSFQECINLKIIDPNSAIVFDPNTKRKITLSRALDKKILDGTGRYNNSFSMKDAIENGFITFGNVAEAKEFIPQKGVGVVTEMHKILPKTVEIREPHVLSTATIDLGDEMSEGDKTRARITIEPTYQVKIGRAKSLSPQREAQRVILQKLRRKIVTPQDAVKKGIIDEETAKILSTPQILHEAIENNSINPNDGKIIDPQRGDLININAAISRGLLDPDGGSNELLFPLNRSLSIPELLKQGLLDPDTRRVVHPETGTQLSISEAIVCDIIDPLSTLKPIEEDDKMTLGKALEIGVVNDETSTVKTRNGEIDIQEAVESRIFDEAQIKVGPEAIPPAGMTFPTALKRGLINTEKKEFQHPITGEKIPLKSAIEGDFIMTLPFPISQECVTIEEALERNLIDEATATFKNTRTGKLIPISEAVETGLLVIKENFDNIEPITTITETNNTIHRVTTRTIELLPGYSLLNLDQVQNIETSEIIPIQIAKELGIILNENEVENTTIVKENSSLSFSEALNKGLVDMNSGTFMNPETGTKIPIQEALKDGSLSAVPATEKLAKTTEMNLAEAFDVIYDESTETFINPESNEGLTFKEAVEKEIIDPNSMIYNVATQKPITVEQALEEGIIDENGKIKDGTSKIDFKEAAKKGLIAVLGGLALPVVAVAAISKKKTTTTSPKENKNSKLEIEISGKVVKSTTIEMALSQKLISPSSYVVHDHRELPFTVKEGLADQVLKPEMRIEIVDENTVKLLDEPVKMKKLMVSRELTPKYLSELGYYDSRSRHFTDLNGAHVSFETLIYDLDLFDPQTILVKDLTKKPHSQYVSLDEALIRPLIDRNSGHMVDPRTGKRVPFFEAVKLRWIINIDDKPKPKSKPITLEELVTSPHFNHENVSVTLEDGEEVTLLNCLIQNIVDPKSVMIRDVKNMQLVPYHEAVDRSLVDPRRGLLTHHSKFIKFDEGFKSGFVLGVPRPISLQAIIEKGIYNRNTGKIKDVFTAEELSIQEAIDRRIVEGKISEIKDVQNDIFIPLSDAVGSLIENGTLKAGEENLELTTALERGLIQTRPVVFSLLQIILSNYYIPRTGRILNPITGDEITLSNAIEIKLIDPATTRIKDDKRRKIVEIKEAFQTNLIDPVRGVLTSPNLMTLDQAYLKGYILSTVLPWSLQETLAQKVYDQTTGKFNINNENLTLAKAIESGIISSDVLTIKDPRSGDIITLNDAISLRLIDPIKGVAVDPSTFAESNLYEAQDKGLIVPYSSQITLPEAVFKGFYDPATGKFIDPRSKERLKPQSAFNRGYVDTSNTLVTIDEEIITFDQAISDGFIDTDDGVVLSVNEVPLDFNEAFERGLLVEVSPPVPLSEAIYKGIYDENSGLFLDPRTGSYLTLIEAIEINLIDAESITVKDTRQGVWRKLQLIDAIHKNYVDGNTSLVKDYSRNDEVVELTLPEGFERGILVDSKAAVSLQRAIHQGLYDESSGKIIDPATERKITLHEAVRKCVVSPLYPCCYDEKSGVVLNLEEASKLDVINKRSGLFKTANEEVKLNSALERGLMIDIETANFSLFDAINFGFYDQTENVFRHPASGRKFNLKEAVENELVNPVASYIKSGNKYVKLPEAVKDGVIDDVEDTYSFANGNQVGLHEAKTKGLIVPGCHQPIKFESAIRYGFYRGDSGKFVDPKTNEFYDLIEAINAKFIDPATTGLKEGNAIKSLPAAIGEGKIDVGKGRVLDTKSKMAYTYDLAFEKGILVTLDRPMDLKKTLSELKAPSVGMKECTLEEAINFELLDPEVAVTKTVTGSNARFITVSEAIRNDLLNSSGRVNFDTQPHSHLVTYENSSLIYTREPLEFRHAIELGNLDLIGGRYNDPQSNPNRNLTLKDAFGLGYIDPDSVLIKDGNKKRLIKLPEGFRKGLIDSEKANVLDTTTSKLHSLSSALDNGLLMTPRRGFGLIEAIQYSLYNPVSGGFTDPFVVVPIIERKRLSLLDAIDENLIDPTSTVVKNTESGAVVPLLTAIEEEVVDAHSGRFVDVGDERKEMDLLKAFEKGLILPAEQRQAFEEKYKLCDETLSKLLHWIGEIEDRIAAQDVIHEFEEDLRNQINTMKQIRDDLENHHAQVGACGDQVRQLVLTAGEILSKSEVMALEKSGRNLKNRFDKATERTEILLKRMLTARDELAKLKSELNIFSEWLTKARRVLEDKERSLADLKHLDSSADSTKEFVSDVIAHQADLRFITMSAQKFVDEGKDYLRLLNEFRTSLPSRLPHIEPLTSQESPVRSEVSLVTQQYKDLLNRANSLSNRLSGVGGRQRDYSDAVEKARAWLRDAEPRALKMLNEPVGADPKSVEEQLSNAKSLNNEFVANGRLIDNAKLAMNSLLNSLDGQVSPGELGRIEQPVVELKQKYDQLSAAISDRCQELETALIQSQGVQDALDGIIAWLNMAENQFKNAQKPASLIKERLDEQIREHRVLQNDIDNHIASVDSVHMSASELMHSTSNARVVKKIEAKLNDVKARFEKLFDRSQKRGEFLAEIDQALAQFNGQVAQFDQWYKGVIELVESRDSSKISLDETNKKMREISMNVESKHPLFEEIISNGKELLSKRDVTDTSGVRDTIKLLENQWRDLLNLLDERQRLSKQRSEQMASYEKLREQINDWLSKMETRVARLDVVAVDLEVLKKQNEELKPITKEYKENAPIIDKLNDIGIAYENLIRGDRPDSPKRKNQYSPTKRPSIYGRRPSNEGRSPSPNKALSPLSTGGSSGFSSRRSSQDGFHLEELSPIQQQLAEVNHRYSLLGVKITDRQTEIDSLREEVRKHLDNLKTLRSFLDKVQRQLPKDVVPNTKEESDKLNKQIKGVLEEMYEKQSLLDSTKSQVKDLVKRKPGAVGIDGLNDELEDVVSHWKGLSDHLKNRIKFMEDMKEFHDTHDSLNSWLGAKERMLTVLGPISSDSRMVQSQVQQVQVLREEFRSQQPQLTHLIEVGDSVLSYLDVRSPEGGKINNKLANIQQKWADLLSKLEERADSLGAAADTSREFDAQLIRLRDALQGISDNLDELPLDKDPEEQLRKIENLERQLEGQRPLLVDLEAAGAHLCEVLSDPASRADIQGKLASIGRQFNALQKKLDHKKAEIEGSLRDGRQFEASCAKTLGWLSDELGSLSERLLVSADRVILDQQLAHHEPIYRDVLAREHEVIMLLNKGRDILSKNAKSDTRTLQRELDKIQQHWDKLKKEAVDRQTRLQTCKEHCRKYYRALENFLPWLRLAEDQLEGLRPTSFQRKIIEKQLKDLQIFRNEVWKKSGEYENTKALAETFLSACDIDKDIVKNEIVDLRTRWDKLNNDLMTRTQSLEDQLRKLIDFNENLRDFQHGLERCEDKLASHDALGGAAKDPKLLERIKSLRDEAAKLKKPLGAVRNQANDLTQEALESGIDSNHLQDEVDALSDRLNELQAKLDDRCTELQSAATAVTQFNEQVKGLGHDLSSLEAELDDMKPPARDEKAVRNQLDEISNFSKKLNRAADDVNSAIHAGVVLVDSGFAPDTVQTRQQVESLKKQLGKLDDRARNREVELNNVLKKLEDFYMAYSNLLENISDAGDQLRKLKPVGSEVDTIRAQQQDFKKFRAKIVEPLSKDVDNSNKFGQGLIQSASPGVNTSQLERDLEKMNELWNSLKDKINDRDRRLDVGLLQSGKFQEALDGLDKWLTDTEDLVANQKAPSADYKVVKAQLQEQKFLKKMLLDRQPSMTSLFNMGNEIAKEADPAERKAIEKQLKNLMGRFDALTQGAQQRTLDLEQAMKVAKEFQDKLVPLQEWLDRCEKKVKDMEVIPTDEEKIQQRIREHDALHNDILKKKPDFSELTDIASNLMSLVGEDEAVGLADKLQEVTDRYGALVEASENIGELLTASRQGLRHLVLTYQDLAAWMDSLEQRLGRYKVLAVHKDKLLQQMDDLTNLSEELASRQQDVDGTVDAGVELMRHISSDEALQLKDKLDSLQRRYNDLTSRGAELLKHAQDMLPLVQQFHDNHNRLLEWMQGAEIILQSADPTEEDIARLEYDLQEIRPVLEHINLLGPQLCQASPGEGASTIEALVTRDNRRFDAIAEQIQRRAERIHLGKQRALEVTSDIDELLEWFREVEGQIKDAEKPSAEPDLIRVQLKEHKALNDDISSQKSRVRDVLSTAKKVLRETPPNEDTSLIREKMDDLREAMDTVSALSTDRLGILEQALPLAEHFHDTHNVLVHWLNDMEEQVSMLSMPALRPDLIAQQQDRNEMFIQSINEHKPLLDKLNKTGEALIKLCNDDDGVKVQELLDSDNDRYSALKVELRARQQALEEALQESSQFSDKLEGMLRALSNTADQVNGLEPISAHPPKIRDQIEDNDALTGDLDKRKEAYAAVQRAADDVINKASNRADPAIKEIKRKLEKLNKLWDDVQRATSNRGNSLEEALDAAQKFWKELHAIMSTLKDLEDTLASQEPPAVEPKAIQEQQVALQEIRQEIDQTKPEVDQVRSSGQKLMKLCGEPDKPEVKKHIEDLDHAWDNITALYAKREENLIDAMEKAMEFHETLQNLLEFLDKAERKFGKMGPLGADIDAVKKQIDQLKNFKAEVDPHMVKVEALNRQAQELTERTSADQAAAIKEPLTVVNKRWDDLLRGVVERQRQLENALLRLGQFQHALNELLIWIKKTDNTLDELKPVAGDTQILEIELAKLKVLINDIQAHQTSIDTLNDAGRQIIESGEDEASATQDKLNTLNTEWRSLMRKAADRQRELEDALSDAQRFNAEIQDLLAWLGDVDGILTASKPVGGLPETASEQLERFMEIYNEIEDNRPKVETVLAQGQEYLKRGSNSASNLSHNLRTLKQRWDSVTSRANDKKIKLEIALKEATEFHEALQAFVDWLTNAEKIITNLKPVSRVLETIQQQIEEHKVFQKDVGAHREIMLQLDKKGTHLKYFSQKQDVILIKNLLISVQHRWERVASKSAERTRALDTGYKEAKEFHDSWSNLMTWLEDTENSLDELLNSGVGNDPEQIKLKLAKHQDFQRLLSGKQTTYDAVMKSGKSLKDKAPKPDEPVLKQMLIELKNKWTNVCNKSVDRQRKLEEALLYSGQFKEAIAALMAWLKKVERELGADSPVHGDLDTVNHLVELHRQFEKELERRNDQMESVMRTGQELEKKANKNDANQLRDQLNDLNTLWDSVSRLSHLKSDKLRDALKEAEKLHMSVNMLLDWLSEAEMKLRFVGNQPEDEATAYEQLRTLDAFRMQLSEKEVEKDRTLDLAHNVLAKAHPDSINVIKNWIKVIQARWEEVSQWALQRHKKLTEHMQSLKDLDESLEELIQWLLGLENTLISLKREELPMDIPATEKLIADHKEFMENTQRRQLEVDRICKARQVKPAQGAKDAKGAKFGKAKGSIRASPGRELSPDPQYPHIGPRFPPTASEPEFRSPRVKFLYDKWRHVWVLSWERQRELYDHLAYLKEKEKADNFSWDDWRKRFLKFMNYKKSRLTDLFRKMDKDNNELIPREDFIDGIIRTKFDTSRLEMKHVADMFDLDNRGLIDWKKFIAALRPDWEDKAPNDSQKIHDEVKRLVMLCTCRQKFRVFQVGEGKYRFGDSQKLRLVRILRSTVMVRVGGGWVALDEFLLKNDPCRAKGRTNIELREQFILADGVSQTMTAFKPKTSASSPASGSSASSSLRTPQGPITKVRERSARSVPMGSLPRTSKSSLSAGTPDSLSDNEGATFRTPRRPSYRSNLTPGGSRPASRPGSRPGSKPPSRHGSNLSLDSTDDGTPSRIPRRAGGVGGRSGSTQSSSSAAFRRNLNGGTVSSGARTPSSGLISPASPVTKSSGIPRASSIPTLTSISSNNSRSSVSSRIPVYKRSFDNTEIESPSTSSSCSVSLSSGSASKTRQVTVGVAPTLRTSARTRTPSGSNTPVPVGQTTAASRLLRRSSGASDTATGQAKKHTNKEPFRL